MNFVNSSENKNEILLNSSYKNIYNDEIIDSMISNENSIKKENDYNLISQEDSLNYNNGNSPLFSKNNSVIKDNIEENNFNNLSEDYESIFPSIKKNKNENNFKNPFKINVNQPNEIKFSQNDSFGFIKCDNITTFFLGQVRFSIINHPEKIFRKKNLNLKILKRDKKSMVYNIKNNPKIIKGIEFHKFNKFINQLNNDFILNSECIDIYSKIKCNKIIFFILGFIFVLGGLLSLFLLILDLYQLKKEKIKSKIVHIIILLLVFVVCLFFVLILKGKVNNLQFQLYEGIIGYRIKYGNKFKKVIKQWNEDLFMKKNIRIWCPITFDYILFNFDPYQDIYIQHHSLDIEI